MRCYSTSEVCLKWRNWRETHLLHLAASDSASEVDGFDSTESSSEGSLSGDSGSSSELVNAEKFKASGVRALDDFVEGKIGVDDIDFEDHLWPPYLYKIESLYH